MTRRLTVELPDEVVDRTEAEAARSQKPVDDVVRAALIEHLGWLAVADVRNRNTDLDDESATKIAYEELRSLRSERRTA